MKKRVLFLCTHNSARSQMAEGLLRKMAGDRFEVFSAGTAVTRVHPLAIEAMRESGIDITEHSSKTLDAFPGEHFDYVITVCDRANESCPIFPGDTERIHWSFDDPSADGIRRGAAPRLPHCSRCDRAAASHVRDDREPQVGSMRWSLLPREPYFFDAFVSMTRELQHGAALLLELLTTVPPKAELATTIHDAEHRCDQIMHDLIQRLNRRS